MFIDLSLGSGIASPPKREGSIAVDLGRALGGGVPKD